MAKLSPLPPPAMATTTNTTTTTTNTNTTNNMMSEKERVLMRYLLEQPSFGRDGHVPPDVLFQPPFVLGTEEEQHNHQQHANEHYDVKDTTNNTNKNPSSSLSSSNQSSLSLRLSGETVSGECLSVSGGAGSCQYQWQRVAPRGAIESIVGAVGPSYVTNEQDIGSHIRVIVRMLREAFDRARDEDATVVAAVSSKHPDDDRLDSLIEGRTITPGFLGSEETRGTSTPRGHSAEGTNTHSSEKNENENNNNAGEKASREVSRDDTAAARSPPSPSYNNITAGNSVINGSAVGKNVAHSALLNNMLIKSGAEAANANINNNSPDALSPNLSSSNLNNYSSGGDDSIHRRRRKEILLVDRADSLMHGPGSDSRLAFIRGKELEAKASEVFRKVSDAESIKRTRKLLDGDSDDEDYHKKKENDSRSYSEWDSEDNKSENSDESDVDFSEEDEFDRDDNDDDDIANDASAAAAAGVNSEHGEDSSIGSLRGDARKAERIARRAKEAYEEAAMKGYPEAMQTLGRCFESGFGTRKDICKAVEWYEKAEKLGCDEAACDLGCIYYLGRFPRDELKKRNQSAHLTDSSVSEISNNGGDDFQNQLAEDRKKAFSLFQHAASNGSGPGANNVAMCYEEGQGGVERNWREAARWYAIAARRGVLSAHASLGYALLTLGNRLSAKEAFESGTQHGAPECADGLRLIREAEKHAANSRKHLRNGANNDATKYSIKSASGNGSGNVSSVEIVEQLEKELEKYHELSRRLYNAASLHPESLEEANAVLINAFPDMNVSRGLL
ncbi:unnamed protein product [Bathycoccus prasinos]